MVRDTQLGTSATAFLVTTEDGGAKHLQGSGVALGRVVEGLDIVKMLGGEFTMKGRLGKKVRIGAAGVV
jgi:hypothetical protein